MIYFDHNATHPLSAAARAAWLDAVERFPGNPSSPHRIGQRAETVLNDARERLARCLGCTADMVIFTSGATEGNNTVLAAYETVLPTAIEHPCVLSPLQRRTTYREIPVSASGVVDLEKLRIALQEAPPSLVAFMAANNETGVLQPWREALVLCRSVGVPMLCDATQWVGRMPARGLGTCDFVTGCAHKFGGPMGVGFLIAPHTLRPLRLGGPQENGLRAGTENVAGVLAMVAALEEREAAMTGIHVRAAWRDSFEQALLARLPGIRILGAESPRLWNTSAVLLPKQPDCRRRWVVVMDKLGFAVSTGSACASGKERPSHVLTAMGIEAMDAGRALRFSAGWETRQEDWEALLSGVIAAAQTMGIATR